MNTTRHRHAVVIAGLLVGLLVTASAEAVITDCKNVPDSFTVYLSEPSDSQAVFPNNGELHSFLERLQFELDQNRDARWVRSPNTDVRFVVCFGRAPAMDGSEFVPSLVELMHGKRVVLEVWGQLVIDRSGPGAPKLSAQMNYLLVPMRFAANQREAVPSGLQRLRYPEPGTASSPDFVDLVARPLDIDAFVAAAFGFKLLREHTYELAQSNLCRASALLQTIAQRPISPRTRDDVTALRTFVLTSAARAVKEALSDPKYPEKGVLRLQDPAHPCAGED